jgi:hypothetical protein
VPIGDGPMQDTTFCSAATEETRSYLVHLSGSMSVSTGSEGLLLMFRDPTCECSSRLDVARGCDEISSLWSRCDAIAGTCVARR